MQRMCMAFDVYFDRELFESCDKGDDSTIGNYFRKLNLSQHKGKTFGNSIQEGFYILEDENQIENEEVDKTEEVVKVSSSDVEKWGEGFDLLDYKALNSHYKYLKTANPNCDPNQEIFVRDLCYTYMQKMKSLRNGEVDAYNKLTESYRKSFNQAGLKTVEDIKTDSDCWGAWVDIISRYTPEEFYKNKDKYKDYDGLGEYYERFAVRPLKNIVLGTQDRDKEFYVREEE